jgi:hypothetical protein
MDHGPLESLIFDLLIFDLWAKRGYQGLSLEGKKIFILQGPTIVHGLSSMIYRLWSMVYGLWSMVYRLSSMVYRPSLLNLY